MITRINTLFLFLLFVLIVLPGAGQNLLKIENLLESNGIENGEEGYEDMINTLLYLSTHPLDLNLAEFDSLKMLFFLSDSQMDELLRFRKRHGSFRDIHELLLVPGIGPKDLENISPFVALSACGEVIPEYWRSQHDLLARIKTTLPLAEGYKRYFPYMFDKKKDYEVKVKNRFHGPPMGTLLKYKYNSNRHIQGGIVLDNDPGEGYFTRHQRLGFDFVSMYLNVEGLHWVRQIIVGDYKLQWGQGLVAWSGFSMNKSGTFIGNEKSGKGFAVNTSTDENKFLRGIALSFKPVKNMYLDFFLSCKKTDATLVLNDSLSLLDNESVALYETGYHRNDNECSKKHNLREFTTGVSWRWNMPYAKIGVNGLFYDFHPGLQHNERSYQRYNDDGQSRWFVSVDYKTMVKNIYIFGETALCDRGAVATVNGLRISLGMLSGCLLYRRYGMRYVSHYASGFGEYGNTSNEEGLYGGLDVALTKDLKLNLYYDWYRFFSARYLATTPDWGWEMAGNLVYARPLFEHTLYYKREVRPEDLKGGVPALRCKNECRYQLTAHLHERWECRTRASVSFYKKDILREQGVMVYQDVIYQDIKRNFKMQGRLAWFDTDSYQSRIYAYENNALYAYSFPAFMGEGWRAYVNMRWKPIRCLTCYLKSGITVYTGRDSMGSGVMRIDGNKKYDLLLQVRITM